MNSDPFYSDTTNTRFVGMALAVAMTISSAVFGVDHPITLAIGFFGGAGWIVASLRMTAKARRDREANDR